MVDYSSEAVYMLCQDWLSMIFYAYMFVCGCVLFSLYRVDNRTSCDTYCYGIQVVYNNFYYRCLPLRQNFCIKLGRRNFHAACLEVGTICVRGHVIVACFIFSDLWLHWIMIYRKYLIGYFGRKATRYLLFQGVIIHFWVFFCTNLWQSAELFRYKPWVGI